MREYSNLFIIIAITEQYKDVDNGIGKKYNQEGLKT